MSNLFPELTYEEADERVKLLKEAMQNWTPDQCIKELEVLADAKQAAKLQIENVKRWMFSYDTRMGVIRGHIIDRMNSISDHGAIFKTLKEE